MRPPPFRLLLALWAAPLAASAQPAPTPAPAAIPGPVPTQEGSAVVQELEVVGRRPGPALWRVTRGDSEAVIVGGLSPLPHLLQWDQIRVQRALQGAKVLFVPATKPQIGLLDLIAFPFRQRVFRPRGGDMEALLTPDLRARFHRAVADLHLNPDRYRHWRPAVAALFMLSDFHRAAGLSEDKPITTIVKLAHADRTPVQTVGVIKVKPWFDAAAAMTDQQDQACLSAALDDLEHEAAHARSAADDWAVGDLKGVRANMSASLLEGCMLQLAGGQSFVEQGTREAVQTLRQALSRPGRSVAVIDLRFLLRRDGVLDRLEAGGDPITLPPD